MTRIILASSSPRRKEFMNYLGLQYECIKPDVDETVKEGELPEHLVLRLSKDKAFAVSADNTDAVVIAADTVVAIDNQILGKPNNREDAFNMLKKLQGRTHEVFTGTSIVYQERVKCFCVKCSVTFDCISDDELKTYIASGECDDKAGAYALQGIASIFIKEVSGSVTTVIGLPINEVRKALRELGVCIKIVSGAK